VVQPATGRIGSRFCLFGGAARKGVTGRNQSCGRDLRAPQVKDVATKGLGSLPDEVGFTLPRKTGYDSRPTRVDEEMRRAFPSLTLRWKPEGRDSTR
jgi:hypothetical protein